MPRSTSGLCLSSATPASSPATQQQIMGFLCQVEVALVVAVVVAVVLLLVVLLMVARVDSKELE